MVTRNDIVNLLKQLNKLNEQYMSDEDMSEEEEDDMIALLDDYVVKIRDMIYTFMGGKLDKASIEKMIRFYPDRVYYIFSSEER